MIFVWIFLVLILIGIGLFGMPSLMVRPTGAPAFANIKERLKGSLPHWLFAGGVAVIWALVITISYFLDFKTVEKVRASQWFWLVVIISIGLAGLLKASAGWKKAYTTTVICMGLLSLTMIALTETGVVKNNKKKTPQEIQTAKLDEIQRELERLRNKPAADPSPRPEPTKVKVAAAEDDPFLISFNKKTGERLYRVPKPEEGGTNWIVLHQSRYAKGKIYWGTPKGSPTVKITVNREGGPVIYYPDPDGKSDLLEPKTKPTTRKSDPEEKEKITKIKVESTSPGIGNEFRIWHAK